MTDTERLIRAYYAAFDAGDREAMLALLAEEVVHDINQGPREVGKPAFRAFRGEAWMPDPCRACPERARDFAGCRCQAFALTGDAAAAWVRIAAITASVFEWTPSLVKMFWVCVRSVWRDIPS